VIPQSFGTFLGQTLTIHCVCPSCNNRLGKDLDEHLARNTYEGLRRYQNGLLSGEARAQKGISISVAQSGIPEGAYLAGVPSWIDGTQARARFKPVVGIRKSKTQLFDWLSLEDLKAASNLSAYDRIPIHLIGVDVSPIFMTK